MRLGLDPAAEDREHLGVSPRQRIGRNGGRARRRRRGDDDSAQPGTEQSRADNGPDSAGRSESGGDAGMSMPGMEPGRTQGEEDNA